MKRMFSIAMAIVMVLTLLCGCSGGEPTERADALDGTPVTPQDIGLELPGLDSVGVIPEKQYFIAFSNGETGNSWSRALVEDMENIAEAYGEQFGMTYEWTNAGNDSTKQLSDIQSLIAKQPDLLIVDPNEVEPLAVVYDWCKEANIPLITIDKELDIPCDDTYVCKISYDNFFAGLCQGLAAADYLTAKNGTPVGNIAEIAGVLGASPSIYRSQGLNYAVQQYEDINIAVTRAGEWDNTVSYQAAQDILTAFPEGTIDFVVGSCDDSAIVFAEAAAAVGRTEFGNAYAGMDCPVEVLRKIAAGEYYCSVDTGPYYAYYAFEYAINYLNGVEIPDNVLLKARIFTAETEEKQAAIEEIIAYCDENGYEFVPAAVGYYDLFSWENDPRIQELYAQNYYETDAYKDVPYYVTTD